MRPCVQQHVVGLLPVASPSALARTHTGPCLARAQVNRLAAIAINLHCLLPTSWVPPLVTPNITLDQGGPACTRLLFKEHCARMPHSRCPRMRATGAPTPAPCLPARVPAGDNNHLLTDNGLRSDDFHLDVDAAPSLSRPASKQSTLITPPSASPLHGGVLVARS